MPPKSSRETSPSVLKTAILHKIDRKMGGKGDIAFPCVPSLIDPYMAKLGTLFDVLGKKFNDAELAHLREIVQGKLDDGWNASPFSLLTVAYETKPPPHPGVQYTVDTRVLTMEEQYAGWLADREPPFFGKLADAKVMDVAASLGPAADAPVLDVGAGTGRNALPLVRRGHPTDAIEPVASLADLMRKAAEQEGTAVNLIEGNVLDPLIALKRGHYKLIVMAEVIASHFRDAEQVRRAITTLCDALAPGGLLVFNTFLAMEGYKPDTAARQFSQVVWSCVFTRSEMAAIAGDLPLGLVTDESAFEYEKAHLSADGWPPTGWFVEWAQGLDLFAVPAGRAPIDLRWLVYRRK